MDSLLKLAYLFEEKYAIKSPEAPKNAPFGEYAWAKYREGVPEEQDTDIEKQIYNDIKKHFASKRIGLPKFTVRFLMKLLKKEYYKSVLHPPPHKTLYRGLKLNKNDLLKLIKSKDNDLKDKGSIEFNKAVESINGFSTSWTFKKKITKDFSKDYGKAKSGYAVILVANVEDNENRFLAGPGGLYDVDGLSRWHLEKETVGLEPIIISKIEWEKI